MSYVNFEAPEELVKKAAEFLKKCSETGRIKKGMNEATKNIERQKAKFVAIAGDVDPPEVVFHLPILCDEKKVPYIFISSKEELGKAVGLQVGCSAVCVIEIAKGADGDLKDIASKIATLKK